METNNFKELDVSILSEDRKEPETTEIEITKIQNKTVKFNKENSINTIDSNNNEIDSQKNKNNNFDSISNNTDKAENINIKKRRETSVFTNRATIYFGPNKTNEHFIIQNKKYGNNRISTTKYHFLTWFPKSLLMQFKRIANIYFLIISILTTLKLSPKNPYSQILTFIIVIMFSMIKEAIEDVKRYNSDNEINNKLTSIFNYTSKKFINKFWYEIRVGDLVQINKDEPFPADILIIKSSFKSGLSFVDTKDLDGETSLKEKILNPDFNSLNEDSLYTLEGSIQMDQPNEYMDSWEGNIFSNLNSLHSNSDDNQKTVANMNIKQLLLKGSILRNTKYIIGIVIYCGHNTKIMKNAKNPPMKMSNVMRVMNTLLMSVFIFQIIICIIFSGLNFLFRFYNNIYIETYIGIDQDITPESLIQKFFTFIVAYSHLIPISLYVSMELVKLLQSRFVFYDDLMFDYVANKPSQAKTTDLIEELGQVQFIFSDKTGTLTQNAMEFKKCYVGDRIYGDTWEEDSDNSDNSVTSDVSIIDKKYNINDDASAYKILAQTPKNFSEILTIEKTNDVKSLLEFFMVCSICHSGIVDYDEDGNIKYSSSSPDEIALIQGAKKMGFIFNNRTSDTIEVLNTYTEKLDVWEVLGELPFDSDRKRMSLLVKNRDDLENNVFVLCKGADNVMMSKIIVDGIKKNGANDALYKFSCEGLRTLVLGMKIMNYTNYKKWNENYKKVMLINEPDQKEKSLHILYEEIEKDFNLVGVTAIEDKLQEGVPETIELLIKSGIRIWVLTGDKKETALIIGRTCRLIEEIGNNSIDLTMDSIGKNIFSASIKKKIEAKLDNLIKTLHIGHFIDFNELMKFELDEQYYMVTDGAMLIEILNTPHLAEKFFKIGILCRSVICCRVSPKQKSQIVNMAKKFGNWITLAVGDGANDVPMIMEAHIGVGIQGKEGTQAVRSADYALCQFKFLQRLILIHGRNGYRRISTFICYYFYKNIILVFAELPFVFFSGFSGQLFFADSLSILYNSLWTSWPCIFAFSIEKDIIDDKPSDISILKYKNNLLGKQFEIIPYFYKAGQKGVYFNLKIFWGWLCYAVIHGGLCYLSVILGIRNQSVFNDGKFVDHWWVSTVIFSMIIHVVTYKIFIELSYWNYLVVCTSIGSVIFYYVCIFILDIHFISRYVQNELTEKVLNMFQSKTFWIYVITLPLICVMTDIGIKFFFKLYNPSPLDVLNLNKIRSNKEDVNIVKKLSTILDPKAVYNNRKSGILSHGKKNSKGYVLYDEDENVERQLDDI